MQWLIRLTALVSPSTRHVRSIVDRLVKICSKRRDYRNSVCDRPPRRVHLKSFVRAYHGTIKLCRQVPYILLPRLPNTSHRLPHLPSTSPKFLPCFSPADAAFFLPQQDFCIVTVSFSLVYTSHIFHVEVMIQYPPRSLTETFGFFFGDHFGGR